MKITRLIPVLLSAALVLASCNLPQPEASTPTVSAQDMAATAAAQTVEAVTTQLAQLPTQTEAPPEPTNTAPAILPTNTEAPPLNTAAPVIPTNTVAPTASAPCDRAGWVSDVTVPDGTDFRPGETFVKTWRIKNTGTCTWTTGYKVVFKSGNAMGAPASWNLTTSVAPNQTVDISANMTAPANAGTVEGFFKLQNERGVEFGLGDNASQSFWVKIDVVGGNTATPGPSPTPGGGTATATLTYFAVQGVDVQVDTSGFTGACPYDFPVSATVRVSRPGTITYQWVVDGQFGDKQEAAFDSVTPRTFTSTVRLSTSGSHVVAWYNDTPNHQLFDQTEVILNCTSTAN